MNKEEKQYVLDVMNAVLYDNFYSIEQIEKSVNIIENEIIDCTKTESDN